MAHFGLTLMEYASVLERGSAGCLPAPAWSSLLFGNSSLRFPCPQMTDGGDLLPALLLSSCTYTNWRTRTNGLFWMSPHLLKHFIIFMAPGRTHQQDDDLRRRSSRKALDLRTLPWWRSRFPYPLQFGLIFFEDLKIFAVPGRISIQYHCWRRIRGRLMSCPAVSKGARKDEAANGRHDV